MTDAVAIADSYAHKNAAVETAYISNAGLTPQLEVPDKLLNIMRMFYMKITNVTSYLIQSNTS